MSRKRQRDGDEQRLRAEFPGVYADYAGGRIRTLKQALRVAGLAPDRSRVQKLMNSWTKATAEERDEFLQWLGAAGAVVPDARPATMAERAGEQDLSESPIATGRYLTPSTIARIKNVMARRRLRSGDVMAEMGFPADDPSLGRALLRNTSLRLAVIAALATWLKANAQV